MEWKQNQWVFGIAGFIVGALVVLGLYSIVAYTYSGIQMQGMTQNVSGMQGGMMGQGMMSAMQDVDASPMTETLQ